MREPRFRVEEAELISLTVPAVSGVGSPSDETSCTKFVSSSLIEYWFQSMGFDLAQVLSDDKHYSPFVCSICQHLVTLDALVTDCAHPFCRSCLGAWANRNGTKVSCPTCERDISGQAKGIKLGFVSVAAEPLRQAQPLAFHVLKLIQVACIDRSKKHHCEWTGDYTDFMGHALKHGAECVARSFIASSLVATSSIVTPPNRKAPGRTDDRPSLLGQRSSSSPSLISAEKSDVDGEEDEKVVGSSDRTPLANLRSFSEKDLGDEAVEPISLNDLMTKKGESQDPRKQAGLPVVSPHVAQRRTSDLNSSFKSEDRSLGSKTSQKAKTKTKRRSSDDRDSDLDVSYSQATDWNMSINSLGGWNNSFSDPIPMETLAEDADEEEDYELEFELDTSEAPPAEKTRKLLDRAEKLKKQANAKFNKGDFTSARSLYTDAIAVMSQLSPQKSPEQSELLSNMHSNRAVTFFREKKFEKCIDDCDKAIDHDPLYDKSWIRKWRALMALGNFDSAYDCLVLAAKTNPESNKIHEELNRCQGDKRLLTEARKLLEKGEFQQAREVLKPFSRSSDNIGLLFLAARADVGLGYTETALEKINKALRFNPTHVEGLELRGHCLFLTGETEKAAHLLQEAYGRNKDNRGIRLELMRCQKTHSSVTKGRSCVKRGRYSEAVDHFSTAIKESGRLPSKAPLFGIIRTERAEAFLLSKKYSEALHDCKEVLDFQPENAPAWSVRAEILIALGKADEGKFELLKIRSTWGWDNPTIDEAYRRIDFELRVLKADDDLMAFVEDLENGRSERILSESAFERRPSRRRVYRKSKSGEEDEESPRGQRERQPSFSDRRPSFSDRRPRDAGDAVKRTRSKERTKDASRKEEGRSRSRPRSRERSGGRQYEKADKHEKPEGSRSASAKRGGFVPPPSIEDLTNDQEHPPSSGKDSRKRPGLERQAQSERGVSDRRARRPGSVKRT